MAGLGSTISCLSILIVQLLYRPTYFSRPPSPFIAYSSVIRFSSDVPAPPSSVLQPSFRPASPSSHPLSSRWSSLLRRLLRTQQRLLTSTLPVPSAQ